MSSPPAPLAPLDSILPPSSEPQPTLQSQPDGSLQALDVQAGLADPLKQLQGTTAREGEASSPLVQSPPFTLEKRVASTEKLPAGPEEADKRKQREKDDAERKRREQESLEFQQRFDLSPTEPLIEDYSCAHTATGAIYQGRLYLSKSYMCFYSPFFSKLLRINLRKLVEIEKRSTLGVIPNGIEVTTENGKKLSFISFIYRDQAYNTLCRLTKEIKELGTMPPSTPHTEELPNIETEDSNSTDVNKLHNSAARRSTLIRSLSATTGRATSPSMFDEERRAGSRIESSSLRVGTPGLEEQPEAPKSPMLPTHAARDKETAPSGKRLEDLKGGKENLHKEANGSTSGLLNGTKGKQDEGKRKEDEKDSAPAVTTAATATAPPAAASLADDLKRETSPPRPPTTAAATITVPAPASAVPPALATQPLGDPLATVPVTDKCQHLTTTSKSAPVLTCTIPLSLSAFFRRVMGDGTNTWMLALKDPNADSFFTQTQWSASKEKCCLQRRLEFQVPYTSPIRSAVTRVVQEHSIRLVKKDYIAFESSSQSLDVPYSDSFSVSTRIDVEETTVDASAPSCHLAFRTEVKWLKSVWMLKSTIESKAIEGNTAFLQHWVEVAKRKATEIETPEPPKAEVTRGEQKVIDEKPLPQSDSLPVVSPSPVSAPPPAPPSTAPPVAQAAAAATKTPSFSPATILIGIGLLILLLIFLFLRVSSMETQLSSLRGANERLERRLVFLQSFVSAISENITGTAGSFKEQVAHWQAYEAFRRQLAQGRELTRTAAALLERMAQQQAEYELSLSRAVAEHVASSAEQTAVLFAESSDSSASWGASLVALLITAVLAMIADLYLLSGAVTFRLLRRHKPTNPNTN